MQVDERVRALVLDVLDDLGLVVDELDERMIATTLAGERRRSLPVLFEVGERTVRISAPFCAAPDERHAEVYRLLLRRNRRSGPVHFALADDDVVLVGELPVSGLEPAQLEAWLGRLLSLADETFDQVLRTGFASYLDYEQRWRASVGLPPNPVGARTDDGGGARPSTEHST